MVKKLYNSKILEIGSGNGFFICYALKRGLNVTGIEPGTNYGFKGTLNRALNLLRHNSIQDPENYIVDAVAEDIPFNDNSFDIVISMAVLEHVHALNPSMDESIRVLKPNGFFLANVPNYSSFYEGHYNNFWLPFLRKKNAKFYVSKVLSRNPDFIDELIFISRKHFKKFLDSTATNGVVINHGSNGMLNYFFSRKANMTMRSEQIPLGKKFK